MTNVKVLQGFRDNKKRLKSTVLNSSLNNTIHNTFMATVYKEASLIPCIHKFQS